MTVSPSGRKDLYRSRAEKAGIIYIDVWNGFVDEAGLDGLQIARPV